jgi:hypothetical protein
MAIKIEGKRPERQEHRGLMQLILSTSPSARLVLTISRRCSCVSRGLLDEWWEIGNPQFWPVTEKPKSVPPGAGLARGVNGHLGDDRGFHFGEPDPIFSGTEAA